MTNAVVTATDLHLSFASQTRRRSAVPYCDSPQRLKPSSLCIFMARLKPCHDKCGRHGDGSALVLRFANQTSFSRAVLRFASAAKAVVPLYLYGTAEAMP